MDLAKGVPMTSPDIRERAERLAAELHGKWMTVAFPVEGFADLISQALLEAHKAGRAEMREEAAKAENADGIYRCCGCGLPVLMGNVKPCDCVTEVAFRRDLKGPSIRMAERGPLDRLATAIRSIT